MAAWTSLVAYQNTTDGTTSGASTAFTPTAGGLMAFYVMATGTVASAPTLAGSANSVLFTLQTTSVKTGVAQDTLYFFIADRLTPASPVSMSVTFTCTADAATGFLITGGEASGMTQVGAAAIKQTASVNEVAAGTAPATTFAASALTANLTLFGQFSSVGTARTAPSGWTKQGEVFLATPTSGAFHANRNSGFTGTVITSGLGTNGVATATSVEFDTSAPTVAGYIHARGPNYRR